MQANTAHTCEYELRPHLACNDCVPEADIELAAIIWTYMKLNHDCKKSDVIMCLGSSDIRVAERAASLWMQGYADVILFSGNVGTMTFGLWSRPEAEVFRDRAVEMGVPREKILVEPESRNTGENIRFSHRLLCEHNIHPRSVILVQKPFMERRTYATFMKQWPGESDNVDVIVTSPEVNLLNYPKEGFGGLSYVIAVMVGTLARMKLYEELGFQIAQEVPDYVQAALDQLVKTGRYNSHLPDDFE